MSFKNQILIASSLITHGVFKNSVIFVHDESAFGVNGFALNIPMEMDMAIAWSNQINWPTPTQIFHGGPVNSNLGYVLHSTDYNIGTTLQLNDKLNYTTGTSIISDIRRNKGPALYSLLVGVCRWSPGQLETEIAHGMWIVVDFNPAYFFTGLSKIDIWKSAIKIAATEETNKLLDI